MPGRRVELSRLMAKQSAAAHCIADMDFTQKVTAGSFAEGPYLDGNGWGVFLVQP